MNEKTFNKQCKGMEYKIDSNFGIFNQDAMFENHLNLKLHKLLIHDYYKNYFLDAEWSELTFPVRWFIGFVES